MITTKDVQRVLQEKRSELNTLRVEIARLNENIAHALVLGKSTTRLDNKKAKLQSAVADIEDIMPALQAEIDTVKKERQIENIKAVTRQFWTNRLEVEKISKQIKAIEADLSPLLALQKQMFIYDVNHSEYLSTVKNLLIHEHGVSADEIDCIIAKVKTETISELESDSNG